MTTPIKTNPLPQTSRDNWITPQEQLKRLLPTAEKITEIVPELIPDIANLIARYAAPSSNLFNWYDSLEKLKILPQKAPPLRDDIGEILQQKDPLYSDGTDLTVGHFLTLIPELGTLDRFEYDILRPYGEAHYPKDGNPLKISYQFHVQLAYEDVPFGPIHWELRTNLLPGSRNRSYDQQVEIIDSFSKKSLANYKIPSLHGTIAACLLHKIATGENLYEGLYTRVKDKYNNKQLKVGHSVSSGIDVSPSFFPYGKEVGIAAVLEL